LALWQANYVKDRLEELGYASELVEISTQGDKDRSSPFSGMSGSGFFTKAIEEALLAEEVDIAVHSHKDLETTATPGTRIAAIPQRAEPKDLLLVHPAHKRKDPFLPIETNGVLGSSSPRRQEQIRMFRPDLRVEELRGNVPTRLEKLREEEYSAILIAKAGIDRLEIDVSEFEAVPLAPDRFISAPAQGALAVQIRESDEPTAEILEGIHDPSVAIPCRIERGILQRFRGGCQLPLGAFCREEGEHYRVWSMVLPEGGSIPRRLEMKASKEEAPEDVAERISRRLKSEEKRKVLITTGLSEEHWWALCLQGNGHDVSAISLIEQEALPVERIPEHDALFFSSRNGVRFYLQQGGTDITEKPIATYSEGTAEELAANGLEASFIGQGDPDEVARSLGKWMEGNRYKRLLMPGPEESADTIPELLREKRSIELHQLPVYRTLSRTDRDIPSELDTLIFTSPSNVRAFEESGHRIEQESVLAIGSTTAKAVEERFPKVEVHYPDEPGLLGLLDLFFTQLR
jgi:hydroxymethylbilane synthase